MLPENYQSSSINLVKLLDKKNVEFLYTSNKRSEREIKKPIPCYIIPKRIKYLGIQLPKEAKRHVL